MKFITSFLSLLLLTLALLGLVAWLIEGTPESLLARIDTLRAQTAPAVQPVDNGFNASSDTPVPTALDVKELRRRCVAEVKSNRLPEKSDPTFCEQYARATRSERSSRPPLDTLETPIGSESPPPIENSEPQAEAESGEPVSHCSFLRYGSIEYRDCRKQEYRRLENSCRQLTNEAERQTGKQRKITLAQAQDVCRAHRNYRVLD